MPDNLEILIEALEDESIVKVLSSFKLRLSLKVNADKLSSFASKTLTSTVDHLARQITFPTAVRKLHRKKHNRVKLDIAYEIANFCFEITPTTCKKCSSTYVPSGQEQDDPTKETVQCIVCDKSAHQECYTAEALDVENGVAFLCTDCMKSITGSYMETMKLFTDVKVSDITKQTESKKQDTASNQD